MKHPNAGRLHLCKKERKAQRLQELKKSGATKEKVAGELARLEQDSKEEEKRVEASVFGLIRVVYVVADGGSQVHSVCVVVDSGSQVHLIGVVVNIVGGVDGSHVCLS